MKFDSVLMDCVRADIDAGLIPMLLGEPGIGKSSWLMNLADLMHTRCFTLACNQLADKADLTGARLVPYEMADGTTSYKQVFYPHAIITEAIDYARANPRETPILFLDELNRTTPDVTSEALSIPTLRAIGSTSLPDNLRVVIAGNDKGNVTALDEASISRFVLYRVKPDVHTYLALDDTLNPFVAAVLKAHPECIFQKTAAMAQAASQDGADDELYIEDIIDDGDAMSQLTTPRTITAVSRWLNTFDNDGLLALLQAPGSSADDPDSTALLECIEGHVGATPFAGYLYNEIAANVTSVQNQANIQTVGKPSCYDDMKAAPDMAALDALVDGMTDSERSGCLVYALSEKADNTAYISSLAARMTALEPSDMKKLLMLAAANKLDSENVAVLSDSGSPISSALKAILDIV